MDKLTKLWLDKIQKGDVLDYKILCPFSKIKLKSRRAKKKFKKNYDRYVSKKVYDNFVGIIFANPLVKSFDHMTKFEMSIEPAENLPKIDLFYVDYKYEDK